MPHADLMLLGDLFSGEARHGASYPARSGACQSWGALPYRAASNAHITDVNPML
jgi:hypothetical protein